MDLPETCQASLSIALSVSAPLEKVQLPEKVDFFTFRGVTGLEC